ncbi:MAG: hypothetical protein NC236_01275 [Mycoplasma sp.]|nr:hypothetical protein [Mycoplasma sp.]
MLNKLKAKMNDMNSRDWTIFLLWISTFISLIVFVVLAATLTKDTTSYANTLAALGVITILLLFSALIVTVLIAYNKKKEEDK